MNRRIIRNKKGVAIEMAVSMMMVVFAMCTLFITLMYISKNDVREANKKFESDTAVEAIGEKFVTYISNNEGIYNFYNLGNSDDNIRTNIIHESGTGETENIYTLKVSQRTKSGTYVVALVVKVKQTVETVDDKKQITVDILSWGRE